MLIAFEGCRYRLLSLLLLLLLLLFSLSIIYENKTKEKNIFIHMILCV
jgi:hypothetical protein